jgi:hypothetical protein
VLPRLEATVYVLLHEATHMVDVALGLTPVEGSNPAARTAVQALIFIALGIGGVAMSRGRR